METTKHSNVSIPKRVAHTIPADKIKDFMLAGDAIMSIESAATQNYLTYRIEKHKEKPIWLVGLLRTPDNTSGYMYLGTMYESRGVGSELSFKLTHQSKETAEAMSVKVFQWLLRNIHTQKYTQANIRHEGYCGRCGRLLTTPESVEQGFGPVCVRLIAKEKIQLQLLK